MRTPQLWAVLCLVGAIVCIARRMVVLVTVRGRSMAPTYHDGDVLLACRARLLRAGRAVVFTPPDSSSAPGDPPYRVKRIAALAGDPTPNWVSGGQCTEPLVPPGRLVVRGDSDTSEDSRTYGFVAARDVAAVIIGRLPGRHQTRTEKECQRFLDIEQFGGVHVFYRPSFFTAPVGEASVGKSSK